MVFGTIEIDRNSRKQAFINHYQDQIEVIVCKRCALSKNCESPVPGEIFPFSDFLFIGLAPGRFGAEISGKPFTRDRSGSFFRKMVSYLEGEGMIVSITNIVKCNPTDDSGNNRDPRNNEINKCTEHLLKEIVFSKPRIIVTLGRIVTSHITGIRNITMEEVCGKVIQTSGRIIVPIYHPSAVTNYHKISMERYHFIFQNLVKIREGLD